jgi:small subunit ribosomal protein S4
MRYIGRTVAIARAFGEPVFNTTKVRKGLEKKGYGPGQHGKAKKKKSEFGAQLVEQQKLRAVYGMIPRKQLVNAYHAAAKRSEALRHNSSMQNVSAAQLFVNSLESRLDNIVYRLRFAPTIFSAQQLVNHRHILVNGKCVDRRSYQVKQGDIISIKTASREMPLVKNALVSNPNEIPSYLSLSEDKTSGKVLEDMTKLAELPLPVQINVALVCEFLSFQS